ncbi:hypothetical protein GCM10009557_50530 [Virgisporangium ochraceum]
MLRGRAEVGEQFHVPGVGRGAVQGLGREVWAASEQLAQRRVLQVGEAAAEPGVGQEQVPQAGLAGLLFQVLDDGRAGPRVGLRRDLLIEHRLGRIDVLGHEVGELLVQFRGAFVEAEVHTGHLCSETSVSRPDARSPGTMEPIWSKPAPTVWPWVYR